MTLDEITRIKAELYDLQMHNCDGAMTFYADHWEGHGCSGCSRQLELQARLVELSAAVAGGGGCET